MSNVYILGSGFSASCGLPTLTDLFSEILKYNREGEEDAANVRSALEHLYPHFDFQHGNAYPSFEEFLSLIFICEDFGGTSYDPGFWKSQYKSSLRLLTDCIAEKSERAINEGKDKSIEIFIKNVSDNDTIITFNWDTLIEKYLMKHKKTINLVGDLSGGVTLLKLHGSLSWQCLPNDREHFYPEYFLTLSEEERLICRKDHDYMDLWDALNSLPHIITPIRNKTPLQSDFIKKIWHEAFNALIQAEKILIIGYSLPPEDSHARALLRSSIQISKSNRPESLFLIDPNPDVAARYYSTITPNMTYMQRYFNGEELGRILS